MSSKGPPSQTGSNEKRQRQDEECSRQKSVRIVRRSSILKLQVPDSRTFEAFKTNQSTPLLGLRREEGALIQADDTIKGEF
jgi:hypothetical protein